MDVRRLVPPYHGMRLERLNVGTPLIELLTRAAANGMQAPPVVAMICKSLANVDGSARIVDPRMDVVGCFRDFLPEVVQAHLERVASLEEAAKLALDAAMGTRRVTTQVSRILEKLATGRMRLQLDAS